MTTTLEHYTNRGTMNTKTESIYSDPEYLWTGCECDEQHQCGIEN